MKAQETLLLTSFPGERVRVKSRDEKNTRMIVASFIDVEKCGKNEIDTQDGKETMECREAPLLYFWDCSFPS